MRFVEILSVATGLVSIGLSIYAIWFAKKEADQSAENYIKTKELLDKIEKTVLANNKTIGFTEDALKDI